MAKTFKKKVEEAKEFLTNVSKRVKKQEFTLPDGTEVVTKIKPKLGDKTRVTVEFNKKVDDVEFAFEVSGQPLKCYKNGIKFEGPDGSDHFKAEFSATKSF